MGTPKLLRRAACTAAILLLTACTAGPGGPSSDTPSPEPSPIMSTPDADFPTENPSGSAPVVPTDAELTIQLMLNGTDVSATYNLVCRAETALEDSDHPMAADACAQLQAGGSTVLLTPPPKDQICTQQYGGPQRALVTGMVHGSEVNAAFSLTDGCRIARWNALDKVLGGGAGV